MAKTIDDYKKDYAAARAANDAAGMKAANNGANAIRESQGIAKEYATTDINTIAGQSKDKDNSSRSSSVSSVSANNAVQQALIDKMNSNSLAWHTASAENKKLLEAQNQNYASQLSTLGLNMSFNNSTGTWQGSANTVAAPTVNAVTNPGLNSLSMGDLYGLSYDYDKILSLLNKATQDSYAVKEQEAKQSENTFYRNMFDTQSTALDTLRQSQAAAVATGASRGMAAANELSAILGLQDASTKEATTLADARTILSEQKQAELSKNASSALDTSNTIKQAIAGLDLTKYGYDVQGLIGQLDYLAALYGSDKTLEGVKYNADTNLAGTKYAADNQPVYSGSSGKSYYTGSGSAYSGNSGSGNAGSGNTGTVTNTGANSNTETNASVANATGGSISAKTLDSAIAAGGGTATLSGTAYLIAKNDDGTYRLTDGSGKAENSPGNLTWQQVARVQNNNDINAWRPNYGVDGLSSALEQAGKKIQVGTTSYVYSSDGKWYSGTAGKTYSAAQIREMDVYGNNSLLDIWRSSGVTVVENGDGSVTTYPSGTKGSPGKTTADILTSVRNGSLPNGALYTVGGAQYRYDANSGLWTNKKTKASITVAAFNKLVAGNKVLQV